MAYANLPSRWQAKKLSLLHVHSSAHRMQQKAKSTET